MRAPLIRVDPSRCRVEWPWTQMITVYVSWVLIRGRHAVRNPTRYNVGVGGNTHRKCGRGFENQTLWMHRDLPPPPRPNDCTRCFPFPVVFFLWFIALRIVHPAVRLNIESWGLSMAKCTKWAARRMRGIPAILCTPFWSFLWFGNFIILSGPCSCHSKFIPTSFSHLPRLLFRANGVPYRRSNSPGWTFFWSGCDLSLRQGQG